MSDRLVSVPLVNVDSYESLNVGTWAGIPRTWHGRLNDLSVPADCRSFCIGWLNLNKFDG